MRSRASLLAACVLAAGCGGSGGEGRLGFAAGANRICVIANRDLDKLAADLRRLGASARNAKALYTRAASLTHLAATREAREAADLGALAPPARDGAAIGAWLADIRRQASLTAQAAGAFAARNPNGAGQAVQEIRPVQSRAHTFASKYGMPDCGKSTNA